MLQRKREAHGVQTDFSSVTFFVNKILTWKPNMLLDRSREALVEDAPRPSSSFPLAALNLNPGHPCSG